MPCELYNILKEGDLRNIPSPAVAELTFDEINALYDDDVLSVATTLSGVGGSPTTYGLLAEYGESYDICYVDYYTSEDTIDNLSIRYGTTSGVSEEANVSLLQPGLYRGEINTFASFVEVRHTVSGIHADVHQLRVIAFKNETLGFGTTPSGQLEHFGARHATVDTLSAGTNRVPVFNHNHFDEDARVAVVPTFTKADNYLFLSTSLSGTYYGIDDFGIQQPGPNPILLEDDPMSAETLHPQWEVLAGGPPGNITPTVEGVLLDFQDNEFTGRTPTGKTSGLLSKEFFSAGSFVFEVEFKVTLVRSPQELFDQRRLVFALANGYPLPDYGYVQSFTSDGRRGSSTAGVSMRSTYPEFNFSATTADFVFRASDGVSTESIPNTGSIELGYLGLFGGSSALSTETGFIEFDEMEDILSEEMADTTDAANWHKVRISFDHKTQRIAGYADNVFLGSTTMRAEQFAEGCRIFIGMFGPHGIQMYFRNFKIWKDRIHFSKEVSYTLNGGVASATISGSQDNVEKLNDGSTSTAYVGPLPDSSSRVRVDFDKDYDVASYTIRQRDYGSGISAFGKTYYPDVARSVLVDWGGKRTDVHLLPNSGNQITRTPTYSGTHTVVSGINYVEWQFLTYDEATQADSALVIEELSVNSTQLELASSLTADARDPNKVPWIEGRWLGGLKSLPGSNSLVLRTPAWIRADYWPYPELMQAGVDYGFSSAVNGRQFRSGNDYHHGEVVFSSPGSTGAGNYTQWHSAVQAESDPIFLWRYFTEEREVTVLTFDSSTLRPSNVADFFKYQYLRTEGNPNVEADWIDIPPVTKPHTNTSTAANRLYQIYKDFLIANNDGEFYTDYSTMPVATDGSTSSFSVGGTVSLGGQVLTDKVPSGQGTATVSIGSSSGIVRALDAIIELDEPVRTRGIRLVVKLPTIESGAESGGGIHNPGDPRYDFALENFRVWCNDASASYLSPVFDTGTRQNTERLRASIDIPPNTEAEVFVRSSDIAPESSLHLEYEIWRNQGHLGDVDGGLPNQIFSNLSFGVPYQGKLYYAFETGPWVHDPQLDTFDTFGSYPDSSDLPSTDNAFEDDGLGVQTASNLRADDRVDNWLAVVGDHLYVAAYVTGNARVPRLLRYRFDVPGEGWTAIQMNRPPSSEYTVMSPHESLIYFFNRNGTVVYWDIDAFNWIQLDVTLPTFGTNRSNMASCKYKNRQYFFGGTNGTQANDFFDFETRTFFSGNPAPKQINSHRAVAVEEEEVIYVFPRNTNGIATAMKYYPEEDRWVFTESLMWNRQVNFTAYAAGDSYVYYDGYIYRLGDGANGFSKTLVRRPPWEHGKSTDIRDPVWGGQSSLSDLPWRQIDTFGELMPQKRYFQFKVEMHSYDKISSPTLAGIKIVNTQSLPVPASGTSDLFLKIGVSEDSVFRAWYAGEARGFTDGGFGSSNDTSILTAASADGVNWHGATLASGVYAVAYPTNGYAVAAPWVIKNSETDYEYWFERGTIGDQFVDEDPEIWYVRSNSAENLSTTNLAVQAINDNVISQTAGGVRWPSVIKESASDYKIWYTGYDTNDSRGTLTTPRIFYAESTDGAVWTNHQLAIDAGEDLVFGYDELGSARASVLLEDGVYRMWYAGVDEDSVTRILYRESTDGITWGAISLNLDIGFQGFYDTRAVTRPTVTKDTNGSYYMYYWAWDGLLWNTIQVSSPDGFGWTNANLAFPTGGLQGRWDSVQLKDVFVLVDRNPVIPGEVITTGKLKLHNEGGAL